MQWIIGDQRPLLDLFCAFFVTSDMEDAHVHLLAMDEDADASFFAVYDGHGGTLYTHLVLKMTRLCRVTV